MDLQGNVQETGRPCTGRAGWKYTPQVVLFLLLLAIGGVWFWWSESGDWVLKVNGTKISEAEWQAETDRAVRFFGRVYGLDLRGGTASKLRDQVKQQILNQMINRVLLKKAAIRAGIRVDDAEVDARLAGDADRAGGIDRMQDILKEQGLSLDKYREQVRDMLIIQKLQDQVTRDVKVEENEIRTAYEINFPPGVRYEDVRETLRQNLLAAKKNQIFMRYLENLRKQGRFMYRTKMPK